MLALDVDVPQLGQIVRDLQATPEQARNALSYTLRKMATWLKARATRGLSAELQLQQRILRRRLKSFRLRKNSSGQEIGVWFGLNDIGLIHMGARQTRTGVTAGTLKRPGAFIARSRGGGQQAFKRKGAARLPLEKQVYEIADKAQVYIEDNLLGTDEFDAQFLKIFERELRWQARTK